MNWKVLLTDYPSQFRKIESQALGTIHKVLASGSIHPGRHLDAFEESLAKFTATTQAVAVSSCHDAMELALSFSDIGPDDEVITTQRGFTATVNALQRRGAKVVFVATGEDQLIDPQAVVAAITPRTKAIIAVHLNGHVCDMSYLRLVAKKHQCKLIEDASQALGASFNGKPVGSWGHVAFFDLGPDSLITGYGSAGAAVTSDEETGSRLRALRDVDLTCGPRRYLDNLQAAVLDVKLKHLPDDIRRRRELAEMYHNAFRNMDGLTAPPQPTENSGRYDVFHSFEIQSAFRDELAEFLTSCGIEYGIPETAPSATAVTLPIHPELTVDNVQLVAQCVTKLHQTQWKRKQAA